jgi:hypothetical protein
MPDADASPAPADAPHPDLGSPATSDYVQRLLDLLGDRDPFEVQRLTVPALRDLVETSSDAALRQPEAEGKWSVVEVIAHLADTELAYGYRLRMIVAHDRPEIQAYDQDAWAERLHYADRDPVAEIDRFALLRDANLDLLRGLSHEAWDRVGVHAERGEESVRRIHRMLAGHDLAHLRQIDRIQQALA